MKEILNMDFVDYIDKYKMNKPVGDWFARS